MQIQTLEKLWVPYSQWKFQYFWVYKEGDCPIHTAALKGKVDVVKCLIQDYGVDPASQAKVSLFVW